MSPKADDDDDNDDDTLPDLDMLVAAACEETPGLGGGDLKMEEPKETELKSSALSQPVGKVLRIVL